MSPFNRNNNRFQNNRPRRITDPRLKRSHHNRSYDPRRRAGYSGQTEFGINNNIQNKSQPNVVNTYFGTIQATAVTKSATNTKFGNSSRVVSVTQPI